MTEQEKSKVAISIWFCIIVGVIVLVIYFDKCGENFSSLSRSDLGSFGDYFGGLLNPIFAAANLIVLIYISLWVAGNDRQREERDIRHQKTVALYSIRQDAVIKLNRILDKVHLITLGDYNQNVKFEMGKISIELGVFLSSYIHIFPQLAVYDRQPINTCMDRMGDLIQAYFSAVMVPFGLNQQLDPNRAVQEKAAMIAEMSAWNQLRGELTGILIGYIQID